MKLAAILRVDNAIKELEIERNLLMVKFETEHAPYKIGERATISGYAYGGKQLVVQRITLRRNYSGYFWFIYGVLVLKSGTIGKATTSFQEGLKEGL